MNFDDGGFSKTESIQTKDTNDAKITAIMARLKELEEYESRTQNLEARLQELATDFYNYRIYAEENLSKITAIRRT